MTGLEVQLQLAWFQALAEEVLWKVSLDQLLIRFRTDSRRELLEDLKALKLGGRRGTGPERILEATLLMTGTL